MGGKNAIGTSLVIVLKNLPFQITDVQTYVQTAHYIVALNTEASRFHTVVWKFSSGLWSALIEYVKHDSGPAAESMVLYATPKAVCSTKGVRQIKNKLAIKRHVIECF
jgi:hypothetical protein